jgi:muconolactone D-isomerase
MEFLVQVDLRPVDIDAEEERRLRVEERNTGQGYRREGVLTRIWRLPGRRSSISLWKVADADQLHERLSGFPLFQWMEITVTPLARHYLEAEDGDR